MPRKTKKAAILEELENDEDLNLDGLREIGEGIGRLLWVAMNGTMAQAELEAEEVVVNIAIWAREP